MKTKENYLKKKSELNLQLRLKRLFNNQYGIVVQVYDEIVHCIGMPNVKIGEIVIVQDHIAKRAYKGLVININ
jgi:F0F1-type ATP synthase alpha subunit